MLIMKPDRKFPPRKGDLPRDELAKKAYQAIADWGGNVEVHFKFTCPECGFRCTLQEPNKLYENGECCNCGKTSPIDVGGFMLHAKFGGGVDN